MIRTMVGFAAVAIIGIFVLNLVFGLLGMVVGLAVKLLIWAAIGYGIYLLLKVIAPDVARRVRELIKGKETETPAA